MGAPTQPQSRHWRQWRHLPSPRAPSVRSLDPTQTPLAVLELITERLRDADRKRAEFGSMDAAARVAARLTELAEKHGQAMAEGFRIDLALSQEELASWA